ncbi:MAG: type III secretion system chaperone, partial [Rhizobiaceae bacterium]
MITRHEVNNALAEFSHQTGLSRLSLGPDDVATAEFGDEGIIAICFDGTVGCVRLLSPVGQLEPSMPLARQAALLRQTLAF